VADTGALVRPLSVRQAGIGDAAIGSRDALGISSDPANVFPASGRAQIAAMAGSSLDGPDAAFGVAGSMRWSGKRALGMVVSFQRVGGIDEYDAGGVPVGRRLAQDTIVAGIATGGERGRWRTGVLVKVVSDRLGGVRATGLAGDVGTTVELGPVTAAAGARNLSRGRTGNLSVPEVRAGAGWRILEERLAVAAEGVAWPGGDRAAAVRGGVEWRPAGGLALRAGAAVPSSGRARFSFGITGALRSGALDYACATRDPKAVHSAAVSYAAGAAQEP
jgi:hypothetical protein